MMNAIEIDRIYRIYKIKKFLPSINNPCLKILKLFITFQLSINCFNFYPACFIGREAVKWMMEKEGYLKEEAIELGQILIERGIIHHVTDEHSFQDSYLFYRFCVDE